MTTPAMATAGGRESAGIPLNKRLKGRPGWAVLGVVVVAALVIGALRSGGPLTDDDRVDSVGQRLACPTCDGESVYESQSPAAVGIRSQIKKLIETGSYSDDQIISIIEDRYDGSTQLVPKGTGIEATVWALPVIAVVCAGAGLVVAFRRWKRAADTAPTDSDRALVDAAILEQDDEA